MAVTDLERLVVTIEANTANIDKKLRALSGEADAAFSAVEARTSSFQNRMSDKFLSITRLTRQLTIGFAAVQAIRFGENIVENFDKIAAHAKTLGIVVDSSLGAQMRKTREEWDKAWTELQIAVAPVVAQVARLVNLLTLLPRGVAAAAADISRGTTANDILTRENAGPAQAAGKRLLGGPFATDEQFLAFKEKQAQLEAAATEKMKKTVEDRAKLQREIGQINAAGTETMRQQVLKERFDAIAAGQEFELQSQIELNESIKDSIDDRVKIELDAIDKVVKAEEDKARRQQDIADRLNERIIGDFAQTAADVIVDSKNIGDAFSGLMRSIASAVIENTIKDALVGTSIKGLLGFAVGGRPPVGVPSVVGEDGPEIFVPDVPGRIFPNGSGGGSGSIVLNVDARGAQQGVAEQLRAMLPVVVAQAVRQSDNRFARNYGLAVRDKL